MLIDQLILYWMRKTKKIQTYFEFKFAKKNFFFQPWNFCGPSHTIFPSRVMKENYHPMKILLGHIPMEQWPDRKVDKNFCQLLQELGSILILHHHICLQTHSWQQWYELFTEEIKASIIIFRMMWSNAVKIWNKSTS